MLITRETDYALRIVRALAGGERKTTGEISRDELISEQFAYKIIKKLERAGLLEISRGTNGGCRLTAELSEVTLYDLMLITGADIHINQCTTPGRVCPWQEAHHARCAVHRRLEQIQSTLNNELRACSLRDILDME